MGMYDTEITPEIIELFERTRVDHGLKTDPLEEIWEEAEKQWFESHTRFPTIEEINAVIEEVRNERKNNS